MKRLTISLLIVAFVVVGGLYAQQGNQGLPSSSTVTISGSGATSTQVQGAGASGAAAVGNPVLVGGITSAGNARTFAMATNGVLAVGQNVQGADAVANSSNMYLTDGVGDNGSLSVNTSFFNGTTWDRQVKCPTAVPITLGAAGTLQIVAPVAGQKVRVCALVLTESVAGTVQLTEGTGATCATGSTNVTGAMTGALGQTLNLVNAGTSVIQTNVSGDGLCLVNGAATVSAGFAQIEQH